MKIAIKPVISGFFIFSIICDERRRPRRDAPAVDQQPGAFLKNTELPRRAPEGHCSGEPSYHDFHGSGVNSSFMPVSTEFFFEFK